MPAMIVKIKDLALRPSCSQSRFSRASNTAEMMGTIAPAAKSQHRARYLQQTTQIKVPDVIIVYPEFLAESDTAFGEILHEHATSQQQVGWSPSSFSLSPA